MQHEAQAFRQLVEATLAPVLLCYLAYWIRRLRLPQEVWQPFCVPEVLRDGGRFVLDYEASIQWEHSPLDFLPELSGLFVKGWTSLARHLPPRLNLVLLEVDQRGRLMPLAESQPLYQCLLRWHGGITALALLALIDEQGGHETRDTKATMQVFLTLFQQQHARSQSLRELMRQIIRQYPSDKRFAALVEQVASSRLDVEIDWLVDVLDGLLGTSYFHSILKTVLVTIRHRDLSEQHWWWVPRAERAFAASEATVALRELLWDFPWTEWKRSRQTLWRFLSNRAISACRTTYPEPVKWIKSAMKTVRKRLRKEIAAEEQARKEKGEPTSRRDWVWFFNRLSFGELTQWLRPEQLATVASLPGFTLTKVIFKSYCHLGEADRQVARLRYQCLRRTPRIPERDINAEIRQLTRRSVGAIRQAKHRVKHDANPRLQAELLKLLSQ